jgi:natural product biosynthesis luciferase-like monooxygenase protein
MKFAIFTLSEQPEGHESADVFSKVIEQAQAADELGYEAIWLAEHHFTDYGILPSPPVLGAAIAARTTRLRIGSGVSILPFHNPIRIAEDYAVLDVISGGRLDLGVGRGYQPAEFAGFGVSMAESRARFAESLDIIEGLWTNETFSYQGEHFQLNEVELRPKPIQAPPPIWMAAVSPESFDLAAKAGRPFLSAPQITPLSKIKEGYERYRSGYLAAGYDPTTVTLPLQRHVFAAPNPTAAYEDMAEGLMWYQRKNASRMSGPTATDASYAMYQKAQANLLKTEYDDMFTSGSLLFDTSENLVDRIGALRDELGLNYLMCWMNAGGVDQKVVLDSMERFATEVMPHFADDETPAKASA